MDRLQFIPACSECGVPVPAMQEHTIVRRVNSFGKPDSFIVCPECYKVEHAAELLRADDNRCPQCKRPLEGSARYPFCACGYEGEGSMYDLKVPAR